MDEKEEYKLRDYILLIIVIILLILCIITSFRTGQRYYEISHAGFEDSKSNVNSDVAKFYFDAHLILKENNNDGGEYEKNNY